MIFAYLIRCTTLHKAFLTRGVLTGYRSRLSTFDYAGAGAQMQVKPQGVKAALLSLTLSCATGIRATRMSSKSSHPFAANASAYLPYLWKQHKKVVVVCYQKSSTRYCEFFFSSFFGAGLRFIHPRFSKIRSRNPLCHLQHNNHFL